MAWWRDGMKKSYHIVANFTAAKKSYGRMATSYLTCDNFFGHICKEVVPRGGDFFGGNCTEVSATWYDFFANVAKEVSVTSYDFFANVAQQVSATFDNFFVFHFILLLSTVNFNAMSWRVTRCIFQLLLEL